MRSHLITTAGLVLSASPVFADFTDGFDNGSMEGNTSMQQSRQFNANGQGYGNGAGSGDGYARSGGYGDGEVTFSITFKGKGRSEADNAMSQSRSFMGNMFQSRGMNNYGAANGGAYNGYYTYPYAFPVYYPQYYYPPY